MTELKPSEIIDKALTNFIPDKEHWTTGAYRSLIPGSDPRFCLLGALGMATNGHYSMASNSARRGPLHLALEKIRDLVEDQITLKYGCDPVADFNDTHTYDEVRAVAEKARAALQEIGQ